MKQRRDACIDTTAMNHESATNDDMAELFKEIRREIRLIKWMSGATLIILVDTAFRVFCTGVLSR